jgi:hypothetical protein
MKNPDEPETQTAELITSFAGYTDFLARSICGA